MTEEQKEYIGNFAGLLPEVVGYLEADGHGDESRQLALLGGYALGTIHQQDEQIKAQDAMLTQIVALFTPQIADKVGAGRDLSRKELS